MKSGCIYCKYVENGSRKIGFCKLSYTGSSMKIQCDGSIEEKNKCPEWGATIAAEKYYKNKSKDGD